MTIRASVRYLLLGLELTRRGPFAQIALIFSAPALLAAGLVAMTGPGDVWRSPVLFVLQSITTVFAPVVFMMAVSAAYAGERTSVGELTRRGLPWLPRYLWTNVHTSLVFWIPVGALLLLRSLIDPQGPALLAWWTVLGIAALLLHSGTVLAPFFAVHSDLPGTRAAWESWRMSRRHLGLVVTTLVIASLPAGLPTGLIIGAFMTGQLNWPGDPEMLPQFTGVALQLIRLTLVPAFYLLYQDIGHVPGDELPAPLRTLSLVGRGLVPRLTAPAGYKHALSPVEGDPPYGL